MLTTLSSLTHRPVPTGSQYGRLTSDELVAAKALIREGYPNALYKPWLDARCDRLFIVRRSISTSIWIPFCGRKRVTVPHGYTTDGVSSPFRVGGFPYEYDDECWWCVHDWLYDVATWDDGTSCSKACCDWALIYLMCCSFRTLWLGAFRWLIPSALFLSPRAYARFNYLRKALKEGQKPLVLNALDVETLLNARRFEI